jgi:hypothetical protein
MGINQVVWDVATSTPHVESDELTARYSHSQFYDLAAAVQIPLAQTLAHNRLFREIVRDKLRKVTCPCQKRKLLKNKRFQLFFRGMRKWVQSGGGRTSA